LLGAAPRAAPAPRGAAVVLGPLLIAIGQRFGVDPIHLGAIIVTPFALMFQPGAR
jgi:TRAP-type C4-dicarboxylate transport system permease large subunit